MTTPSNFIIFQTVRAISYNPTSKYYMRKMLNPHAMYLIEIGLPSTSKTLINGDFY